MKKFSSKIVVCFAIIAFASGFSFPSITNAAVTPTVGTTPAPQSVNPTAGTVGQPAGQTAGATGQPLTVGSSAPLPTVHWYDYVLHPATAILNGVANTVLGVISYTIELVIIPVLSLYLSIVGLLLDFGVQHTILSTADYSQFAPIISQTWSILRDTFNVAFIFILLYIAITTIIGSTKMSTKQMLKNIVIAALFINFSLFISQIIIDGGNLVAIALYSRIEAIQTKPTAIGNAVASTANAVSPGDSSVLSGKLMSGLNLATIYESDSATDLPSLSVDSLIRSVIRVILILVAEFVFSIMAFLILGRFVMLIFLMATSPLGFIGGVIPSLSKYASGWWESLIHQTILAPVFMFLMLLVISLSTSASSITAQASTGASGIIASTGIAASMPAYFTYLLIIFLLFKAVEISKSLSGKVGGLATQLTTAITGASIAAVSGGASLALTQTVGRGAAALASSNGLKNLATDENGNRATRFAGRLALRASNSVANKSFDVRNTETSKGTLGFINKEGGMDLAGKQAARKGGFVTARDEYAKKQADFAKKQLGRDITEEQYHKENPGLKEAQDTKIEKIKEEHGKETGAIQVNIKNQKEQLEKEQDLNKRTELKKGIQTNEVNLQEKISKFNESVKKENDEFAKAVKEGIGAANKKYQEAYANQEEESILAGEGTLFGGATKATNFRKAAADKIRSEIKGKSNEQKLAEAAADWKKEQDEKTGGGEKPNPVTPPAGGSTPPPAEPAH